MSFIFWDLKINKGNPYFVYDLQQPSISLITAKIWQQKFFHSLVLEGQAEINQCFISNGFDLLSSPPPPQKKSSRKFSSIERDTSNISLFLEVAFFISNEVHLMNEALSRLKVMIIFKECFCLKTPHLHSCSTVFSAFAFKIVWY